MNRLFTILVGASITALVLAAGCGSWLFFQSWQEGRQLERQNRELKASLEASRIRLENFCEYPAEALCNIDEPRGSVSGAMSGLSALAPAVPEPTHPAAPAGSSPHAETTKAEAVSEESTLPTKQETPLETKNAPAQPVPSDQMAAVQANAAPATPASAEAAVNENTASTVSDAVSEASVPPEKMKKTWTSLDIRKNAMMLHIAGEGTRLAAKGRMLPEPLRYEVTLDGLWNISNRHPQTALVRDMQTSFRQGDTILAFPLASQPEECSVRQDDGRTVTIIIR